MIFPPMRERLLSPECEAYLGPVAVAQFLDCGWLHGYPLCWTSGGCRAAANGFGVWTGLNQRLPMPAAASPWGAAHWSGRRTKPSSPLIGGLAHG
jgi:hypothetical protein